MYRWRCRVSFWFPFPSQRGSETIPRVVAYYTLQSGHNGNKRVLMPTGNADRLTNAPLVQPHPFSFREN